MANYVKGIDVAHWEPEIDWAKVRAQDIRFAFIKATQANFVDSKFISHWSGAKQAGILRGAYHFIDPRVDGRVQAETFLRTVTLEPGDLPPVLDLEDLPVEVTEQVKGTKGGGKKGSKGSKAPKGSKGSKAGKSKAASGLATNAQLISCAEKWLTIIEAETGRKPIIYSGPFFLKDRMCGPSGAPPRWADNYPLWVANYLDHEVGDHDLPLQPKGWADWTFWQYSEDGLLDGIFNTERTQLTAVDLNFYRGTLAELYELAGAALLEDGTVDIPKLDVLEKLEQGEVIVVADTPVTEPETKVIRHRVKAGDTLGALAIKFHTTVDAIMALNPQITNRNIIRNGDTLNIPQ